MNQTIMERLRADTRPMHDQTEGHPFQKALFGGSLPRAAFVNYLSQLLLVHRELERQLVSLKAENPVAAAVILDCQLQEQFLTDDLKALDVSLDSVKATAGTDALVRRIAELGKEKPLALLGYQYVLFGSKHGGKMLARHLHKLYGFGGDGEKTYFDPYGPEFMDHWRHFKESMNEAQLSESEQEDVVSGAKEMFTGMSKIFDDLA